MAADGYPNLSAASQALGDRVDALSRHGQPLSILRLMQDHPEEPYVLTCGFFALAKLKSPGKATSRKLYASLHDRGASTVVTSALARFPDDPSVCGNACCFGGNLATLCPEAFSLLLDTGLVPACVRTLSTLCDVLPVVGVTASHCAAMLAREPAGAEALVAAGAVPALLAVVSAYDFDPDVLCKALTALGNLAANAPAAVAAGVVDGLPLAVDALRAHAGPDAPGGIDLGVATDASFAVCALLAADERAGGGWAPPAPDWFSSSFSFVFALARAARAADRVGAYSTEWIENAATSLHIVDVGGTEAAAARLGLQAGGADGGGPSPDDGATAGDERAKEKA